MSEYDNCEHGVPRKFCTGMHEARPSAEERANVGRFNEAVTAMGWTLGEGVSACRTIEQTLAELRIPCHVALTGGTLFKEGPRKDLDVIIYRKGLVRPSDERPPFMEEIDRPALIASVCYVLGYTVTRTYRRVVKLTAKDGDRKIDLMFPECDEGPNNEGAPYTGTNE